MKTVLTIFFVLSIMSAAFSQTVSPDVFISSGEVIESADGIISWTIGENLIETISESDLNLLQGYQEIEEMPVAIETIEIENTGILVFPTATDRIVNVVFNEAMGMKFKGWLIDILGKRCAYYEFNETYNQIDLSEYAYGMYLLCITDLENKRMQEIKLIKY